MMKWIKFSALVATCFLLLGCVFTTSAQAHVFERGSVHNCRDMHNCPSDTHHRPIPRRPIIIIGQQGPVGPQGPTGLTGPRGVPGTSNGIAGPTGPQGPIGLTGATGPQGPIGLTGAAGPQGVAGITGNAGFAGPNGAVGATGAQGATGPTGPIGAVGAAGPASELDQFGYVYNVAAQAVPIEGDVTFDSNSTLTTGLTHTAGTSQIVVTSGGLYQINFSVSATAANQFQLFLNGAAIIGSLYGSGTANQQNNGQVIINLTVGDVITLRNHTSATAITLQTLAGGTQTNVNASIVIEKISPTLT